MKNFCVQSIKDFAKEHPEETFYAFAIDASLLCLNSLEQHEKSVKEYQAKWLRQTRPINSMDEMSQADQENEEFSLKLAAKYCGLDRNDEAGCLKHINESRKEKREKGSEYFTEEGILSLKENTGDWPYQGFTDLSEEHGFDTDLYQDHYDEAMESEDGHAPNTPYAEAMNELVMKLKESDAFATLGTTDDFKIMWVDHDY